MRIDRVDVIHTAIPLKSSFRTSFGAISAQHSVVTKVYSEGLVAYGEACPFLAPIYSYECVGSVQTVLGSFIIPSVPPLDSSNVIFRPIRLSAGRSN
jgi:O-succinylbenzoate synthase